MAQRSFSFDGTESKVVEAERASSGGKLVRTDEQVGRVLEITCKGTLEQFQALVEAEEPLSKDSEHRLSRRIYLTLYGPIARGASLCWLVSNGANASLAGHSRGERGISVGTGGRNLALLPEMTLDEIVVKASEIDLDLCRVLKVGQVCAAELPQQRIRVLLSAKGFTQPSIFGKWVDGLTDEMERLGFECVETLLFTESEMDLSEREASQLPAREPRTFVDERPKEKQSFDIATIRELLLAAFTADELNRFCQDRPQFRSLRANFGPKYNLNDMIDEVIDFCETRHLWEEFLDEVEQYNPKQYNRFASRLSVTAHAASGVTSGAPRESVAPVSRPAAESRTQVFLCYARPDRERVEALYQELYEAGFNPWMDKNIYPGEKWRSRIKRAIQESDFFLPCLSANSVNRRGFIQKEIRQALDIWEEMLDSDIYLIPVQLEECEVPERLNAFQWVDLFEESGWTDLVRAIRVGMKRRQTCGMESEKLKSQLDSLAHRILVLERIVLRQDYDAFGEDVADERDELDELKHSYISLQEELRFRFGEDYDPLQEWSV